MWLKMQGKSGKVMGNSKWKAEKWGVACKRERE